MAYSFELIASSTVGSGGAANIEFTSIPGTYTDLTLLVSVRSTSVTSHVNLRMRFNGSTSSYTNRRILGSGSSASSDTQPDTGTFFGIGIMPAASATASTFSNISIYCPNYTSSNYKSISVDGSGENNATEAYLVLNAGLWSQTSTVTSIEIGEITGTLVQHSTAYLYGIKNS